MGNFLLELDVNADFAGVAPVLEIIVDGVVVAAESVNVQSDDGNRTLVYNLNTPNAYPDSVMFRFLEGSGSGGDLITLDAVRVNGLDVGTNRVNGRGRIAKVNTDDDVQSGESVAIRIKNPEVVEAFDAPVPNAPVSAALNVFDQEAGPTVGDLDAATVTGTAGDDDLSGVFMNNDVIDGGAGNDLIHGEQGNDQIIGGTGDDVIFGNQGDDIAIGGDGNDRLEGQEGNDQLYGNDGDDRLEGNDGDDIVSGNAGSDNVSGGLGEDILYGGADNDSLFGNEGDDVLFGGTGDDRLYGLEDNDTLNGDAGNDLLHGDGGDDILNGGEGDDRLRGDDGDDVLNGGNGNDSLIGHDGNDTLNGEDGNDVLAGRDGNDILNGGDGDDRLFSHTGNDTVIGGDGDDFILTHSGNDNATGDAGNDQIFAQDGNDILDGGADDDIVHGGAGNDTLSGGTGNDTVIGGIGADNISGGTGDDILHGNGIQNNEANQIIANEAGRNLVYNAQTNSIYEYIDTNFNQATASAAALSATLNSPTLGLISGAGHIVNITSQAENDFITTLVGNSEIWAGGSDSVSEGHWTYDFGAEAGYNFYIGAIGGTTLGASYTNFANNEPNDFITGEDFLQRRTNGQFNDFGGPEFTNRTLDYVIEYDLGLINEDNAVDTIDGGDGNDQIYGYGGNDILNGDNGDDVIIGGAGNDTINGGDGIDTILGGVGADTINGGNGNDIILIGNGDFASGESITGGANTDTIILTDGTTVDFSIGAVVTVENLDGSSIDDAVTLSAAQFVGISDIDLGDGADILNVFADNTDISGSGLATVNNVEEGNLTGDGGNNSITLTGAQLDAIISGAGTIDLGGGNGDTINITSTSADLNTFGTTDDDALTGVEIIDASTAGAGVTIDVSAQTEGYTLTGSGSVDTITGSSASDTINGNAGGDILTGGEGNDTINGGDGNDVITGDFESDSTATPSFTTVSGTVAIEAENFDSSISRSGSEFEVVSDTTAVGGEAVILTNDGTNRLFADPANTSPELTYNVNFETAGTYYVWVRGSAPNGRDDSVHIGFDGVQQTDAGGLTGFTGGGFRFGSTSTTSGNRVEIEVTTPGVHVVSLYAREDGATVDRLVITDDVNFTPTGTGPVETPAATISGDDILNGGAGNDTIEGGAGNDTIDGGAGANDIAIFSGSLSDYTITQNGLLYTLVDGRGIDGTDNVTNVQTFRFSDGDVDLADILNGAGAGTDTVIDGTAGNDILTSDSIPVGTNSFIQDILDNNAQAVTGQGGTQDLIYNADTGNFYQYVFAFFNESGINSALAAGTIDGVAGNLVTFETTEELNFVLDNLGADFGGTPQFANNTIVGDTNPSDGQLTTLNQDGTFGTSGGFRPFVVEFDGDAILGANNTPGAGTSATLSGGAGNDQLFGADGLDIFLFEDATAFGAANRDQIFNFDQTDGDAIDISDILSGLGVDATNIDQFVQIDQFNGVRVDTSGAGQFFSGNANPIATFSGTVDITNSDEATLLANGNLII